MQIVCNDHSMWSFLWDEDEEVKTRISDIFKPSVGGEVLHTSVVSVLQ